ncbi:hypothetical protein CVT25_000922, partial [Psilocybe cyanescens]
MLEQNCSVTFLKHKHGPFKKAYKLEVLCSIDVTGIIFKDRPGHKIKLHKYSSCDILNIVQRLLRRLSGAAAKFDADGDGDNNMVEDEDEDVPVHLFKWRRADPKLLLPDADSN